MRYAVYFLIVALAFSCKKPERKSRVMFYGPQGSLDEVIEGSVSFVRSADRLSGTLKFRASKAIHCALEYWHEGIATSPIQKDCEPEATANIEEAITGLVPEESYTFKIFVWSEGEALDPNKYFIVKEKDLNEDFTTAQMFVARMVIPQFSVDLIQHQLDKPQSITAIRKSLEVPLGCKTGPLDHAHPYLFAKRPIEISSVGTSGFAQGAATVHPRDDGRLQLSYDSIQPDQTWGWSLVYQAKNLAFTSATPGYFKGIFLETSEGETKLGPEARSLAKNSLETSHAQASPLKLRFDLSRVYPTSFTAITLEKVDGKDAAHCIFSSDAKSYTFDPAVLSKLTKGTYTLTAVHESHLLRARAEEKFPTWLISAQDYRFTKLVLN